jgi:hypothetical protein
LSFPAAAGLLVDNAAAVDDVLTLLRFVGCCGCWIWGVAAAGSVSIGELCEACVGRAVELS